MNERIILAPGINGDELLRSLATNKVNCFNVRIMNAVGLARYGLSFIPREKNRKADQLGRTRMLLNMPISA